MLIDVKISRENCIQESSREYSKIQISCSINTANVECKNKSDTSNNSGNWNNLKGIQKIPEQHTGKALNQRATEISHIWHCTHTAESSNVAVQNI